MHGCGLPEWAAFPNPLPALCHQLQHDIEGGLVIVEDDNIFAGVGELKRNVEERESMHRKADGF